LEEDLEKALFAQHKENSERTMKIVVAMLAAVFLFVLYFLIQNG
jgi:hypothetical protein